MGFIIATFYMPYSLFLIGRVPFVPRDKPYLYGYVKQGKDALIESTAENRISVASVLDPLYLRCVF